MPVPKFEDFKAPWETDSSGAAIPADKQVTDPEKLKKHLWNVLTDKDKAQTARDTALGLNTELTSKVTELEKVVATKGAEGLSEMQKLEKSIKDLTERSEKAELERDRTKVATDANLAPEALEFLTGKTVAELKASADKLVGLGLVRKTDAENSETPKLDAQGNPVVGQPLTPKERNNAGDPLEGGGAGAVSVDDFVKDFESTHGSVFG